MLSIVFVVLIIGVSAQDDVSAEGGPSALDSKFTQIYMNGLQPWGDLFSNAMSPDAANDTYYNLVYNYGISHGVSTDESWLSAASIAKAVQTSFTNLSSPKLGEVYGLASPRYLRSRGILNEINVFALASNFAALTREANFNRGDRNNLQVLAEGYVNFLSSLNQFNIDTYFDVGLYFEYAVYYVAKTGPYGGSVEI